MESLFLASIVFAVGGLGFYMYNSCELNDEGVENTDFPEENEIVETKTKNKTKKRRGKFTGTKRRY
jgi:hypothetical protein